MATDIRNCKRCGRVFVYVGIPVCTGCLDKEEEQYRKVKRYLDTNPRAGIEETSDETGVPSEMVIEFLRQGLLVTAPGPGGQLTCMICKKPITRGRICPKCETSLMTMADKAPPVQEPSHGRMYVMEMIAKRKS